ncbi:hypothetical protein WJX79_003529 [Trebouxia sp. C0005]
MSRSRTSNAKKAADPKASPVETKPSRRYMSLFIPCLLGVLVLIAWVSTGKAETRIITSSLSNYSIIQTYPHDPNAFTQGLEYDQICDSASPASCQDVFWESTGLYGQSTVREVDLVSGSVLRQQALPASDFGEGLVKFGSRLFQLTWLSGKTYFYDINNFANSTMQYDPLTDGWGATTDGRYLIVSDGSADISFLRPDTLQKVKSIAVNDNGKAVPMLNELEFINNEIWANIWMTECIAKIDPQSGKVRGWVLFTGLRQQLLAESPAQPLPIDVLNGIAYDNAGKRLFITGKCWPKLYEVKTEVTKLQMSPAEHLQVQQMCGVTL